jgi:hypothetical protein
MWQRLVKVKVPCDVAIQSEVRRNKGKLTLVVPSADNQRLVVICLILITSKKADQTVRYVLSRRSIKEVAGFPVKSKVT